MKLLRRLQQSAFKRRRGRLNVTSTSPQKPIPGLKEDLAFFFDLVAKHRTSEYIFNEHARVKHMLLKSGLDSGQ